MDALARFAELIHLKDLAFSTLKAALLLLPFLVVIMVPIFSFSFEQGLFSLFLPPLPSQLPV